MAQDHACLDEGQPPDRADCFGQAPEAVADQDAHVGDTAFLDLGQDPEPELGSLSAVTVPQAEDVARWPYTSTPIAA